MKNKLHSGPKILSVCIFQFLHTKSKFEVLIFIISVFQENIQKILFGGWMLSRRFNLPSYKVWLTLLLFNQKMFKMAQRTPLSPIMYIMQYLDLDWSDDQQKYYTLYLEYVPN